MLSLGILWFRYHNLLAKRIKAKTNITDDDKLFNEARKWVIATHQVRYNRSILFSYCPFKARVESQKDRPRVFLLTKMEFYFFSQKIVFYDWLPAFLGVDPEMFKKKTEYGKYQIMDEINNSSFRRNQLSCLHLRSITFPCSIIMKITKTSTYYYFTSVKGCEQCSSEKSIDSTLNPIDTL